MRSSQTYGPTLTPFSASRYDPGLHAVGVQGRDGSSRASTRTNQAPYLLYRDTDNVFEGPLAVMVNFRVVIRS